jgi:N-methylhydantoinase A
MKKTATSRFGIDIGGTFTDFIFHDEESGNLIVQKVPSTTHDFKLGCLDAIRAGLSDEQIQASEYFLHGSTVGLNALLERKGARVGLITTKGFRDSLEIRRGNNPECANLWWKPEPSLVPRHLRTEIVERLNADGTVRSAIDESSVKDALLTLTKYEVDTIAVVLVNSFINPANEIAVEKILRDTGYKGEIALSHRISREAGEYERTSTTVVDSYVRGKMRSYLSGLASDLDELGFGGTTYIARSGGGSLTFDEALLRPIESINSGPAGGAAGAAKLSALLGLGTVVTADVGGTSFDTTIIVDGAPRLLHEAHIGGYPVQTAWIDVRSIGAGGGSIAHIGAGGGLKVGPVSAGAMPGPASYSRGGTQPTVTDAALHLGMLGDGQFQSGLTLDREKAKVAIDSIGQQLNLSTDRAASGIISIITAAMSNAIREITMEQGEDPRKTTLIAFGGGGPMLATKIADELSIERVIVPNHAGNFSAWGLLGSDIARSAARTVLTPLSEGAIEQASTLLAELREEIQGRSADRRRPDGEETILEIRYAGQSHSVPIRVLEENGRLMETLEELVGRFETQYRRLYGVLVDQPLQLVAVRITQMISLSKPADPLIGKDRAGAAERGKISAYSFNLDRHVEFTVLDRREISVGMKISGPAIVEEFTTTTYVDADYQFEVHPTGHLIITRKEA